MPTETIPQQIGDLTAKLDTANQTLAAVTLQLSKERESVDMNPRVSGGYVVHSRLRNAETRSHVAALHSCVDELSNRPDALGGELRMRMSLTASLPAFRYHVARILCRRAKRQMGRIDARRVVADEVPYDHTLWNRTVGKFPGKAVGTHLDSRTRAKLAVASEVAAASPNPAGTGRVHVAPEPFFNRPALGLRVGVPESHQATVVLAAKTACENQVIAT